MPKEGSLKSLLKRAENIEKKYRWLQASELYGQALGVVEETDFVRKGEIQEKIAHCFYKAAFQADSQTEFRKRMGLSVEAYEEAARLSERLEGSKKHARARFYSAMASYSKSWLAEDSSERKALLEACRKLLKEALGAYDEAEDRLGYGKACNELLTCHEDRFWLSWDWKEGKNILEEAIEYGEKAIEVLSKVGNEYELARAYQTLSSHIFESCDYYESIDKQTEAKQKSYVCIRKALDISEEIGDSYLICGSHCLLGHIIMMHQGDLELSVEHAKKAYELAPKTRDILMTAKAYDALTTFQGWTLATLEEDPGKRREGFYGCIQLAEDAMALYQMCSYPFTFIARYHLLCYLDLADEATNLEEKRRLLEKTVEVGRKHLEQAERSTRTAGVLRSRSGVSGTISYALYSLSTIETKTSEKRKLLEEALKKSTATDEGTSPFFYWNQGVNYSYLALYKAELTKIETDNKKKEELLKEAVTDMENCLRLCLKDLKARPTPQRAFLTPIGEYWNRFGRILEQLYLLTGERTYLERAIKVYSDAVQTWEKADLHSRVAEGHWQIARLYDSIGEHSKASSEFESGSKKYAFVAEKIKHLKAFYTDHAAYMQAWNEIEKAKHHHAKRQYGLSKVHYEKAADLHRKTERWNFLSPNYSALARIEEAEELSRREQTEESKGLFQQAAKLFLETKQSIEAKLKKIETEDEKKMAAELGKASTNRREYCLGRISLEEAKILDRQGDHAASSAKYASAAQKFQETMDAVENESEMKELKPIVYLSKAWMMMTRAEAETSPDLYLEASQLFDEARKHSFDENARVLALGHSCFCKALEAGARFETTRDMTAYSTAKKHLEATANHYVKAGFKTAAEYARATNRLLDAYLYGHKGEMETDPTKKTQYYGMAEKLLQTSANSYMKANHPEKGDEVRRLLESVKEERQLAMSLTEVLHAPTTTSTTASFTTPNPTYETAVGLEIFEHAHIQANLIFKGEDINVGEDTPFEIEMVNAGRTVATLVKVEEILPADGFKIVQMPEPYRLEDNYLNLKGKQLEPLKTEDIKITIQPRSKGTFTLNPRILYLDETGKYKFHEPEPKTITVKELGISGWIKGER